MKKNFKKIMFLVSFFGIMGFGIFVNSAEAAAKYTDAQCNSSTTGMISDGGNGCKCPSGYSPNTNGTKCVLTSENNAPPTGVAAATTDKPASYDSGWGGIFMKYLIKPLIVVIAGTLLKLTSWITALAGLLLNGTVKYTVVDMATKLKASTGLGGSINIAWKTIRDIANMSFIFVLLYASIQLIIGQKGTGDTRKLIVNLILAALLINFSLFFTKIVIDASNLLSLVFYGAIAPGALTDPSILNTGLSNTITSSLGFSSLLKLAQGDQITPDVIITLGIMGSIFLLIAAFVFVAISLLLIIRFIVLIFVLILSPLAFVAMILPALKSQSDQWRTALTNQAFFAPVFFALLWVSIKLFKGLVPTGSNADWGTALAGQTTEIGGVITTTYPDPVGSFTLIINFILIIGFLIGSLVLAKSMASKSAKGMDKVINKVTGTAGAVAFGGIIGGAGRKTFGRLGAAAADNRGLQEAAAKERTGVGGAIAGAGARLALAASQKARSSTFDPRNAVIPTASIGKAIQGTIGRTRVGKAIGLDDINLSNVNVGAMAAERTGVGEGKKGGFVEDKAASEKRKRDEKAAAENELTLVRAKDDVKKGSRVGATQAEIDAMELALSHLTTKQTEELVAANRDLLKSQEFANRISVQQLESLSKSEALSEEEKNLLKANRFKKIRDGIDALGVPVAARTPAQIAAASALSGNIKGLSDKELEMLPVEQILKPEFIAEMRGPQFDAIQKSDKFTSSQKQNIKTTRKEPLLRVLHSGHPGFVPPTPAALNDTRNRISRMGGKDLADALREKITYIDPATGAAVPATLLTHPEIVPYLKPNMLKKLIVEGISNEEITAVSDAIRLHAPVGTPIRTWLDDPAKGGAEFV